MHAAHGAELIVGDGRTRHAKHWSKWLQYVPRIRSKFGRWHENLDPFHSNETASVAFLANAAAKAGYLALTEYVTFKRHASRGRPFRHGRCDLWMGDTVSEFSWAFEVKQHFASSRIRQDTFDNWLKHAHDDAKSVDRNEADDRVGCLIMVPGETALQDPHYSDHFDMVCSSSDFAFRVGGGMSTVWLAFKVVD